MERLTSVGSISYRDREGSVSLRGQKLLAMLLNRMAIFVLVMGSMQGAKGFESF